MAAIKEYPRRVKKLQEKIDALNGNELTAAESRTLIKALAESQFDLWDFAFRLSGEFEKFKGMVGKIVKGVWAIAATVLGAFVIWLLTYVLPKIITLINNTSPGT